MQRIVFATGNAGKMHEIKMILEGLTIKGEPVELLSMKEAGIDVEIEENGSSFEENALIKARAVADAVASAAENIPAIVMADDSGLEVDQLNGEPGIYSARYLGEDTPYHVKNHNLIQRLLGVPDERRTARFVCAIAAVLPDGMELSARETVEGRIGYEERGENGFGYDPIFLIPPYDRTTAELTEEEKNDISHRGKALRAMRKQLVKYFDH